jgi:hypothetical protein
MATDDCVVCGKPAWDDAHKAAYAGAHPHTLGGRAVVSPVRSRPWRRHWTSIDDKLAELIRRLDQSWFHTRLRARIPDANRLDVKERRTARGVRLAVYWYHRSRR